MLDYRAHKLFWLISWPLRVVAKISFFITVLAAILIVQSTSYGVLGKVALACAAVVAINVVVFGFILNVVARALERAFFWLVDVVPSHGANADEARAVVLRGRRFELERKALNAIETWTSGDTREMVALRNWRARLFFSAKINNRIERNVAELQRMCTETSKQPRDIIENVSEFNLPTDRAPWFELMITNQGLFNLVIAFALIVLAIGWHVRIPLEIYPGGAHF